MTQPAEDREGMIITLAFRTGKSERYFERMETRELIEEYDRVMKLA